jgi:hypothetical protein
VYRRVIEIRDGLLALQPYRTPDATTSAHARAAAAGLTGRALEAAVEAEAVAAALRARAAGAPPTSGPVPVNGGTDLVEDTLFLGQVSAAYRATTGDRPAPRPLPDLGAADHIR